MIQPLYQFEGYPKVVYNFKAIKNMFNCFFVNFLQICVGNGIYFSYKTELQNSVKSYNKKNKLFVLVFLKINNSMFNGCY